MSVGMVGNNKKSAIKINRESPLPESLLDIPRIDEIPYIYFGFEMKKGEIERETMMKKLDERIKEKHDEPTKRVEMFEFKNWINYINRNAMSIVRFYSGPVRFTLGWLDGIDKMVRQHLTQQGMLMKRGMTTSSLYMKPDDMGLGLNGRVGVCLLELVRLLIQFKRGTIFRQEWFWRMEELTKRNGKGVWLREIEKVLKRFDASLEWFLERVNLCDEEINTLRGNQEIEIRGKAQILRAKKLKSIDDVVVEVGVLIDTNFFNEFTETRSSMFLKRVIANQNSIDMRLLKKTRRTLNCSPKTMKVIREIRENLLCVGKRNELITKTKAETMCLCSNAGAAAQHQARCGLLQEGECGDQRPPRHRRRHPPQQHPRPERTDHP